MHWHLSPNCAIAIRGVRVIDKAFPDGAESTAFKGLLKTELYSYQREEPFSPPARGGP